MGTGQRLHGLYARAPVWAQHVLCSLEGIRIRTQRYPPGFVVAYSLARARANWSERQIASDRMIRTRAMLVHAGRNVPYWRELFAEIGFRPEQVQHPEDLQALPILTKDTIVAQGTQMVADRVPGRAGRSLRLQTSGTTGTGLEFAISRSAMLHQWAVCWRYRQWHGIGFDRWSAQLTGRIVVPLSQTNPPYHRINAPGRQVLLSGYHLGPSTAALYLEAIERASVPWIHGYPSLVVLVAEAARQARRRLPDLRWVTLASEATSARQRAQIEAAFGLQPLEHYAQREAVANASQCPLGRLHIDEDFSLVELIPQPEIASGCFRMVGTSLDNWHQPFIRYDPGDLARYDSTDRCSCGRMGRVLQAIEGRSSDYVLRKNGAMIGQLDHIFKPLSYIREAQVRQARPGSVEISVVPRGDWTVDHRRKLVVEAQRWLGAEMQIGVHVVDHLPRTAAGKFRFVVREDLARGD